MGVDPNRDSTAATVAVTSQGVGFMGWLSFGICGRGGRQLNPQDTPHGSRCLAGRGPSADGLTQSFQQASEMRLAMLHPPHAIAQLLHVVSQPCF